MKKKKFFVIDTNALITDPLAFMSFSKGDTVVLPYKVVEELEKHKLSLDSTGISARQCSRFLSSILLENPSSSLHKGITLENGSTLGVLSAKQMLSKERIAETVGELSQGDDFILGVCIALKDKKHDVKLVSNDMMLRIRASSFDIESIEHQSSSANFDNLYSGNRKIDFDDETLSKFWKCHSEEEEFEFNLDHLLDKPLESNEFLTYSGEEKKPYVLLRNKGKDTKHPVVIKEKQLDKLKPLNIEQAMAIDLLMDPDIHLVTLVGTAGTGKTILAIEAGLKQVLGNKKYKKLLILRPVHSVGKEIGFLPGTKEEKLEPWIAPIKDNLKFLLGEDGQGSSKPQSKDKDKDGGKKSPFNSYSSKKSGDSSSMSQRLEYYFEKGIIEVEAMAYIRGRSINDAYIIVDEGQNTNHHELKTILTRAGNGTKIVITGDIEQSDRSDVTAFNNGLAVAINKFKEHDIAGHCTLTKGVRSELSALAAQIL